MVLDITNKSKVDSLPDEIFKHFGVLYGIINNAGIIQKIISVNDLSSDQIEKIIQINLFGTINMTKAFLPFLLKCPEAHIVNISSLGGFMPFPKQTIYGTAKTGVKLFTEGLYVELKDTLVKVTLVQLGAVVTDIMKNSGIDQSQFEKKGDIKQMGLSASKAAALSIRAMEKNKYRVTVGKDAKILDILYRINPGLQPL